MILRWHARQLNWSGSMAFALTVLWSFPPMTTWQTACTRQAWNCSLKWGYITSPQNGVSIFPAMKLKLQWLQHRVLSPSAPVRMRVRCATAEVETTDPCIVHSGPTGTPTSERYHPLILYSCAQEPLVDVLGGGSVSTYMGQLIIPGSPTEILGCRKQAMVARQAILLADRGGMGINDVAVPLTCSGKMAAFDPETGLAPLRQHACGDHARAQNQL